MLGMEPQDRAQGDALARARFAQDAQRLAALEVEADAVHRVHGAVGRDEGDVQVADLQEVAHAATAFEWPEPATCIWQATSWRPVSASRGSALAQTSSANGQRVRKRQPDGGSIGIGRIALDGRFLGALARIHRRPRRQQRARVGMLRIAVDRLDRAELDDLAEIHHQHAVAEILHDVEVVADEDVGEAELALEVDQHVQHLRLDRLVERRHRLVEDHQPRPQRQRAGDVDALALAARQLVRIAFGVVVGIEPDLAQQVAHALAGFGRRQAVRLGREGQRLGDGEPRVERGVGILEHHLHLAAQLVHRDAVRLVDRIAVQHHGAACRA